MLGFQGVLLQNSEKYELDDEEMERINAMANLELNDAKEQLEAEGEEETEDNDSGNAPKHLN